MAEENNQGKQQKPQSTGKRATINESTKKSVDVDSVRRFRKGTAGDTENTGPRKK